MTVSKAEGCSAPSLQPATDLRQELTDYTPKVRLEIVSPDELCQSIVELIAHTAQIGQLGDGLVWVTEVSQAVFMYKSTAGSADRP